MSADEIKALRAAGHEDAAELLEQRAATAEREALAAKGPGSARPEGLRLVNDSALGVDDASRREGQSLLDSMKAAGIASGWQDAGAV